MEEEEEVLMMIPLDCFWRDLVLVEEVAAGEKAVTLAAKMPAEKIRAVLSFILFRLFVVYVLMLN